MTTMKSSKTEERKPEYRRQEIEENIKPRRQKSGVRSQNKTLNPKHEIRNPKQIRMFKCSKFKTRKPGVRSQKTGDRIKP